MSDLTLPAIQPARRAAIHPYVAMALLWIAAAVAISLPAWRGGVFDAMSTDDAMRLAEIRDLLAEQSWFDLTQYRLDPPGLLMHWSRVTDVPLAGLILLLTPLLGAHGAEAATLVVWPLALLAMTLWLAAAAARRLAGPRDPAMVSIAAALITALAVPALIHFRPGAIDHHNSQIVLLLALLRFTSQIERSVVQAAAGGVMASLSLAIGLEMLPAIAALCVAIAGLLVWRGADVRRQVSAFGAALAGSSLLLAVGLIPLSSLSAPVCDAMGGPFLLLVAGGGTGLLVIAAIDRWRPSRRLRMFTGALVGLVLIGSFLACYPGCIASPYARVDPTLTSLWLDRVAESMSFAAMLQLSPQEIPAFYGFPVLTLAVAMAAIVRGPRESRFRFVLAAITLAALFATSLWQVRGAAAACIVAAPIFVAAAAQLWPRRTEGRHLVLLAALVSPAVLGGIGVAVKPLLESWLKPAMTIVRQDTTTSCQTVSAVSPLAQLAEGRVMAPIDLGPAILVATRHSVFAAPYHRNNDGNLAMLNLMRASPAMVPRMLRDRRINYVVLCPASPQQADFVALAPDGLAARLGRGEAIDTLQPVKLNGANPLAVWRVRLAP